LSGKLKAAQIEDRNQAAATEQQSATAEEIKRSELCVCEGRRAESQCQ
jgi:hypothetical protein